MASPLRVRELRSRLPRLRQEEARLTDEIVGLIAHRGDARRLAQLRTLRREVRETLEDLLTAAAVLDSVPAEVSATHIRLVPEVTQEITL